MGTTIVGDFERIKNPNHTGENRCFPCTVLNLLIIIGVGLLIGVFQIYLGFAFTIIGIVVIYFRGYLVPYTPLITEYLFLDRLVGHFTRSHSATSNSTYGSKTNGDTDQSLVETEFETIQQLNRYRENKVDPALFLHDCGILECVDTSGNWQFSNGIIGDIDQHIQEYRSNLISLSTFEEFFDVPRDHLELKNREYPVIRVNRRIWKWPTRSALIIDLALEKTIREYTSEWEALPLRQRMEILESFRPLYAKCPLCSADLELTEHMHESCCRSAKVHQLRCAECGECITEYSDAADERPL